MIYQRRLFISALLLIQLNIYCIGQQPAMLPRALPEAEGVSSTDIISFLNAAAKSKTEFHSFMLLRHGKVIAEGWWNPYRPDLKHTLYSCSKSFTATAIGFAIQEKRLSLDDKVVSFFPKDVPDTVSSFLAELTVKDALMMSDGQEPDPSFVVAARDTNWIKGFLATPIKNEPGTRFLYNSLGTYMLSAIAQKVTGQRTIDYLRPRLFDPLGIRGMDWETDMKGINTGGWGLRLKTEDMAKFAELFLQKGKWNGRQVIPASWVEEASTMKIMQDPSAPQSKKDSSDWLQGYCYQMWRCRNNAYRGDGAYGQFMIVMPDQDAALAITAETADMQEEINLVWKYLLPAFKNNKLAPDAANDSKLTKKIKALALPVPPTNTEPIAAAISGKTFSLAPNDLHLQNISFNYLSGSYKVKLQTGKGAYTLNFAPGTWNQFTTSMPGPSLVAKAIEKFSLLYPAKVAGSFTWTDANTLQLVLRYIESPHSETFTCHFKGDQLKMDVAQSLDFGNKKMTIQGNAKN
jgi:CubicO group peptidase (beta-lactamase class C family)